MDLTALRLRLLRVSIEIDKFYLTNVRTMGHLVSCKSSTV